jgi:hypothetical protein
VADSKPKKQGYTIGQIVYILSNKGQSILPAMIVEQQTVTTLSGKKVSWKLAIGAKDNPEKPQRIADSGQINGEIYSSLDEVKAVLERKLKSFIEQITIQAQKRTEAWYGSQLKNVAEKPKNKPAAEERIDPEDLLDDLDENETLEAGMAHIQTPANNVSNLPETVQKESLQNRLRDLATPTDEEMDQVSEKSSSNSAVPMGFIEGPDGQKIPVNLKV